MLTEVLTIDGAVRNRVYINLIFFKIATGWRTRPFHLERRVDVGPITPFKDVPLTFAAKVTVEGVTVLVTWAGVPVHSFDAPRFKFVPFKVTPWKGVIVEGTVQVTAE